MKISVNEIDKHIGRAAKDIIKKHGYKKRGITLFKRSSDFFISIDLSATGRESKFVYARACIKPYIFDDIFWKVFHMPENSNEPISLRAVGAFAVRGLQLYYQKREVNNYEVVGEYADELIKECDAEIEAVISNIGNDFRKFIEFSKTVKQLGLYDIALGEMLLSIHEQDYRAAKDLALYEIENYRCGHMENEGKNIYEHVVDYCNERGA